MTAIPEATTFNDALFERIQAMNRSWLERLRDIRQIDADFGAKLLSAKTASDATIICNEWMAKRLEIVATEQQAFATAWFELLSHAAKPATAKFANGAGSDWRARAN
jgi:hypothetical protein